MKPLFAAALLLPACICSAAQNLETPAPRPDPPLPYSATVDPAIPAYRPVKGLSGTLKGVESNTVTVLQQKWIDGFTKIYPNVKISVDIGGSGQGGPRLTNGSADFAFIAREMMGREETPFIDKFGYRPLAISVSGGSLAVKAFTDCVVFIVNKDNPLNEITYPQLDAIYSATHNRGIKESITTWGQLGLTGEWVDKPIHAWGVEIPNGYDNFVNMHVLANGQWREGIQSQKTVIPLSDKVAADKYAISYTGLAWDTNPGTKVLRLSVHPGDPAIEPTFENVTSQKYPLARTIYIFVNREPDKSLTPVLREFIRYTLSREGQQAIVDDRIFTPLPAAMDATEAKKLN
ncbi:MAG: substrate-binding domain-containing protein [Acidobacteriota bacterium]|nr:substrate-binding domain-containing protein [Acidobacteriota bacterium]